MPPERTSPMNKGTKSARTHLENKERAYVAASRRSDRSLEARVESARKASQIHHQRTGKYLKITEKMVECEEMYEEEDNGLVMRNRQNGVFDASGFESKIADFYTAKQNVAAVYEQFAPFGHGQMPMYGHMQPQYPGMMPFMDYSGVPVSMADGQFVGPVMTPQGVMMAPRPMMNYNAFMQMKGQPMKPGQPPMGVPMQQPMMPGYNPGYYMGGVPIGHPGNLQNAVLSIQSNQRQHITQNFINKIRQQESEKQHPVKKQEDDSTELKKEDDSCKESKQTGTPPPAIEKEEHFISSKLMQQPHREPSALDIRLEDLQKPAAYYQSFQLADASDPSGKDESEDLAHTPGPDVKQEQTDSEVHQPTPITPLPQQYFNSPSFMGNTSFTAPLFTEQPMMSNQAYSYEHIAPDDTSNDVYYDACADLNYNFDYMFSDAQHQNELAV